MNRITPGPTRRHAALTIAALLAAGRPRQAMAQAQRHSWPPSRATPPLVLPGMDAPAWDLAAARGQVVALNFWASWCEPCRDEMSSLELMAQRHAGDGLQVVAVNFKEGEAAIRRFVERMALSLPVLRDADGAAARAFGVRLFPTTVIVGRDGRARFSVVGETDWTAEPARRWIAEALQHAPTKGAP